ncbi:MAG: alpha/beta fold hydrolase [Sphingomonadales bacterium]|nr:MAG: alpha/beta fold hydrolase [Sphingomonadales bacterium]
MKKTLILIPFLAIVIAGYIWANPAPPAPPPTFTAPMADAAKNSFIREDVDGKEWLTIPSVDGGLNQFDLTMVSRARPYQQGNSNDLQSIAPYSITDIGLIDAPELAGWMFTPNAPSQVGIVILHGSGDSDRDNGYYIALADRLARAGYTLILPDKRGSGRSSGDWRNTPLPELAEDGARWLRYLRDLPQLSSFGFVGVSQGGTIAPQAAMIGNADFAVAIGTSMTQLEFQLQHEVGNDVKAANIPSWLAQPVTNLFTWRAKRRQPGFWSANGHYSPLAQWQQWRGPYFIAYGSEDESDNVPVSASVKLLEQEIARANNDPLTFAVYPGADHGIVAGDGDFSDQFLRDLFSWLSQQNEGSPAR